MNIKILVHIGLLYFVTEIKLLILIVLVFKKFITNKNIKTNIYCVQANDSIMCGYFCVGFIDFMLAGKTLIDYTSLFSPYDFDRNYQIILSYLKDV